jgi:hypothetical protein
VEYDADTIVMSLVYGYKIMYSFIM